jgi:O-antigen/teichoic acid export membrane protein
MVAPRMGLPVVVAVAVSAKANAAFYIAYTLATMVTMIPNHLATVLFAIGRGDREALRPKLGFTLGLSFALGLPACVVTAVAAKLLLSIFGHAYAAEGVVPLLWLTATFPASVVRLHYAAVQRVRGHLTQAWRLLLVGGVAEVVVVSWFGHSDGLDAAMAAFCVVVNLEGLVTLPAVAGALRRAPRP